MAAVYSDLAGKVVLVTGGASGIGKAITNFRKAYREGQEIDVTPKPPETKDPQEKKPSA